MTSRASGATTFCSTSSCDRPTRRSARPRAGAATATRSSSARTAPRTWSWRTRLVWDTEPDAREFFDAYARRTTKRYGVEPSEVAESGRQLWKTKEGGVIIERIGSAVIILEGVPESLDAKTLLKLL